MNKNTVLNESARLFDQETAGRVIEEVKKYSGRDGEIRVDVTSRWVSGQRWARNRATVTSDQRDITVNISRFINNSGYPGRATTNQFDSASLKGAAEMAEYYARTMETNTGPEMPVQVPAWQSEGATVWSDVTFNRAVEENGRTVHMLTSRSESEGFFSAGYIECAATNGWFYTRDKWGRETIESGRATQGQCSITVRHPKGTGSGWAGGSTFDLGTIDMDKIAGRALDKCLKSIDPVRIEPGRYQTILEPQATLAFLNDTTLIIKQGLMREFGRNGPELGRPGPFLLGPDASVGRIRSKLGLKVVDERITIHHSPVDPLVGTHSSPGVGKVTLIKNGVLTALFDRYDDHLNEHADANPAIYRDSFMMDGTTKTIEEMISTTKRGLLVTRFSNVGLLDPSSLLYTGLTRDGLWLIENGKITKAVRNFRWTESPLFVFNNVEEIGESVPVFTPVRLNLPRNMHNVLTRNVVPALKVNDFSFTSTIDAI